MSISRKSITSFLLLLVLPLPLAAGEPRCDWEATACVKYMVEDLESRGWIGIELEYADPKQPRIAKVIPGSAAMEAGLQAGDELLAFEGARYATATEDELREAKGTLVPGSEVRLTIGRNGEEIEVVVTAGKLPQSVLAQWIGSHLLEQHRHQFETAEAGDPEEQGGSD